MESLESQQNFNSDEVKEIIQTVTKQTLQNAVYQASKVDGWISNIVEGTLKKLQALEKPFKYIVTVVIMQRTGAGLHSTCQSYWDSQTDAHCSERYENETLQCVTTVFGLMI